jgi:hypothetical protein
MMNAAARRNNIAGLLFEGSFKTSSHQDTDAARTFGLLRVHGEPPGWRRAPEQRDELAPPDHSITSSARASRVAVTVQAKP